MDREGVTHQRSGSRWGGRPSRPSGSGATRRPTTPPDIPSGGRGSRGRTPDPSADVQATPNGISSGGWMPALATSSSATRSSSVGRRRTRCSDRTRSWKSGQIAASGATEGSTAAMGTRRYTPAMGAVETMEEFFEKLNAGDREGAVAMMDEKTEMRVHVGDNVQTLRGVERVGGWFLRSDAGLRMIPGDIRDTGQHLRGGSPRGPARGADPAHRRDVPRRGRADHRHQHRAPVAWRPAQAAGPTARVPAVCDARRPAPASPTATPTTRPGPARYRATG